eukprot:CAMPEP_0172804000 /NCGR_PEP_ID=MMETSP1075-20121228/4871_1 /TAXON_ID=2916 /ORGANISM="Ceratium fusus, Strain PA161109" /LENGTH=443 /DNA_ID=CAMNT_0013642509 /DNA_START=60 /DNA_END=1391 /DNA_ORIENTATION=+
MKLSAIAVILSLRSFYLHAVLAETGSNDTMSQSRCFGSTYAQRPWHLSPEARYHLQGLTDVTGHIAVSCSGGSAALLQRRGSRFQALPKANSEDEAVLIHYVYGYLGPVQAESVECEIPCRVTNSEDPTGHERADVLVTYPILDPPPRNSRHAINLAHSMEALSDDGSAYLKYDATATSDVKSTVPWSYFNWWSFSELQDRRRQHPGQFSGFSDRLPRAVFVARDWSGRARNQLMTALTEAGVPIDAISSCHPQGTEYVGWPEDVPMSDKLGALKKYRVYMALERAMEPGYVTEKIMDGYMAGNVNVYLGASDIADYVPSGSFIDANAAITNEGTIVQENLQLLIQKIKAVLYDEKTWAQYLEPLSQPMTDWSGGSYEKKWSWSQERVDGHCRMCRLAFARRAQGGYFNTTTQRVEGVVAPPFGHDFWKTTWKSPESEVEVPH